MQQLDVPRFDQLEGGNGNLQYSFDPQTRDLFYADYEKSSFGFLDSLRTNFSFQSQPEVRKIQNVASGRAGDILRDWSDTDTAGAIVQALTHWGRRHLISFGGETYFDFVDSAIDLIDTKNVSTAVVTSGRGRFPHDSRHRSVGLYVHDDFELVPTVRVVVGGRLSSFHASAPDIGVANFLQAQPAAGTLNLPTRLDFSKSDVTGDAGVT